MLVKKVAQRASHLHKRAQLEHGEAVGIRDAMLDLSQLDPEMVSRRMKAAREFRGVTQVQLGEYFESDGLNKTDPGRIERMDPRVRFRRGHLDACVRHLRIPERWFTDEDDDVLVGYSGDSETQMHRIETRLDAIDAVLVILFSERVLVAAERQDIEAARRLLGEDNHPEEG